MSCADRLRDTVVVIRFLFAVYFLVGPLIVYLLKINEHCGNLSPDDCHYDDQCTWEYGSCHGRELVSSAGEIACLCISVITGFGFTAIVPLWLKETEMRRCWPELNPIVLEFLICTVNATTALFAMNFVHLYACCALLAFIVFDAIVVYCLPLGHPEDVRIHHVRYYGPLLLTSEETNIVVKPAPTIAVLPESKVI